MSTDILLTLACAPPAKRPCAQLAPKVEIEIDRDAAAGIVRRQRTERAGGLDRPQCGTVDFRITTRLSQTDVRDAAVLQNIEACKHARRRHQIWTDGGKQPVTADSSADRVNVPSIALAEIALTERDAGFACRSRKLIVGDGGMAALAERNSIRRRSQILLLNPLVYPLVSPPA